MIAESKDKYDHIFVFKYPIILFAKHYLTGNLVSTLRCNEIYEYKRLQIRKSSSQPIYLIKILSISEKVQP